MRKSFKAIIAVVCAAVVGIAAVLIAGAVEGSAYSGPYAESLERINNPDQGFYRPIYVKVTDGGADYNKNIITDNTQLYHLRIDISNFSTAAGGTDKPLTDGALSGIRSVLTALEAREKSAVVRFAYDPKFEGKKDCEPAFSVLLGHIRQASVVLNDFETTVTAIEAGLIGPWGEMHSSKISDSEHTSQLIDEFLKNTQNLPVLVRTPKKIYDYLGITIKDIDGYEIAHSSPAYRRLGLYNDGYLGCDNDLGTYTDRAREVEFLSEINACLPYGGEVVMPDSKLHDIKNCTDEMFKLSLSYLNIEWNNHVIEKWQKTKYTRGCGGEKNYYGQTAFTYIENRLGYRFVLKDAKFTYSNKTGIFAGQLKIKNVGFGNLTKKKLLKLYLTDETGNIVYEVDAGDFNGGNQINLSQKTELKSGNYNAYLCVYGMETDGKPAYAVRFANNDIWNADLKANYVGKFTV